MAALFGRDETDHLHVYIEPKRKNLNWKKRSQKKKKRFATPYKLWLWYTSLIFFLNEIGCVWLERSCHPFMVITNPISLEAPAGFPMQKIIV